MAGAGLGKWVMRQGREWVPWDGESKRRRFRLGSRVYDLRHASITLTLDIYSHLLPDMQETAVVALESIFGG